MRKTNKQRNWRTSKARIVIGLSTLIGILVLTSIAFMAPISGGIFTSDFACTGTNVNIYSSKQDVYLDGGPTHPGAAGLPDGSYYVQVTTPSGDLLGTSVGATIEKPVTVSGGEFSACAQLWTILRKGSNAGPYPVAPDGYDSTTNPGGEYKVWISTDSSFTNSQTKTDNFKVKEDGTIILETGQLHVRKFYDADADGVNDGLPTEPFLTGWKFRIADGFDIVRFSPVDLVVAPDTYTVTEGTPAETNWVTTTANPQGVTIANGDDKTLTFGNVCLGAGGGLTLGYWSNKNGENSIKNCQGGGTAGTLTFLGTLNLKNANGTNFDPVSYNSNPASTAFRSWILNATATNMAYMLSAQLAAMELNVRCGTVNGAALIYAPGLPTVAPSGFASVNTIMNAANTELGLHADTTSGGPGDSFRAYQEALKNALDKANNNLNFVQAQPCPFSFPE